MNNLRNEDCSITPEAEDFGQYVYSIVNKLFSKGMKRDFSERDIFAIIVHAVFKNYYMQLYNEEVDRFFDEGE